MRMFDNAEIIKVAGHEAQLKVIAGSGGCGRVGLQNGRWVKWIGYRPGAAIMDAGEAKRRVVAAFRAHLRLGGVDQ